MRRIVTGAFLSLDGVMQAPGGPEEDPTGGFEREGWATALWDDVIGAAMEEQFTVPFDLLLGRKTYDIFAAHWPYVEMDPTASRFNELNMQIAQKFSRLTKYVATHRPESPSRRSGSVTAGGWRRGRREAARGEHVAAKMSYT